MIHSELSARCDEVRGSKGSSYVGRGRRATCLGASEPPPPHSRYKNTTSPKAETYASCAWIRNDTINIIFSYYIWSFSRKALSLHPNLHTKK